MADIQKINLHIDHLAGDHSQEAQAIIDLVHIGEPAIPHLITALKDGSRWYGAAAALSHIGKPAIPPLIELMRQVPFGNFSFHALMNMGDIAVPDLIEAIQDQNVEVRMWAVTAFELRPDARACDALIEALQDSDELIRMTAKKAIISIGDKEVLTKLKTKQLTIADHNHRLSFEETIRAIEHKEEIDTS